MKRKTASSFIILACTLLLAHAVVPHHHHQKQICIESIHGISDAIRHHHNQEEHDHRQGSRDNLTTCYLSEFIPAPSNNSYRIGICQNSDDASHHLQFILSTINSETEVPFIEIDPFFQRFAFHYFSSGYSSPGLRAPPLA